MTALLDLLSPLATQVKTEKINLKNDVFLTINNLNMSHKRIYTISNSCLARLYNSLFTFLTLCIADLPTYFSIFFCCLVALSIFIEMKCRDTQSTKCSVVNSKHSVYNISQN